LVSNPSGRAGRHSRSTAPSAAPKPFEGGGRRGRRFSVDVGLQPVHKTNEI
jgi:hypothetical protein